MLIVMEKDELFFQINIFVLDVILILLYLLFPNNKINCYLDTKKNWNVKGYVMKEYLPTHYFF